jgi:hypothetical protein
VESRFAGVLRPFCAVLAVSVLSVLGACSGLRVATTTIPSSAAPSRLAAFDFDGDGERDLVALYRDRPTVGVHRVGDDTMASSWIPLDAVPGAVAPLRRDDADGIVVAFPESGTVVAMHEGRDPTVLHSGEPSPFDILVADFDRSGTDDVAIASTDGLALVFQTTDGSFAAPVGFPLDPRPRAPITLARTDLDGDGTIDLLCGMVTGDRDDAIPDHVRAFRNAPHGRLADETWYRVPRPERVAAGDLDGDGLSDVVAFGSAGAWAQFGLGHGWLGPAHRIANNRLADGLVVDVDGDGRDDVVALDRRRDTLAILRSVGPRRFAPALRVHVGEQPSRVVALPDDDALRLVTANARDFTVVSTRRTASP